MLIADQEIPLTPAKLKSILNDTEKAAKAINLVYVNDGQPGITRIKKGDAFHYYLGKKRINDELILERIRKLVIPPAWEAVWICKLDNGHLQATGTDARKRKQYRYHLHWNLLRNHTKFYRLHDFGQSIPAIRKKIEQDLALPGLPLEKVLAAVVCVMQHTSIRVGNAAYEKLYGSFGLTTLKDKHVKIAGDKLQFSFTGKKGVAHKIHLTSKRLAKIVKQCREIPGQELFQYYDEEGNHKPIDSGMVNNYIKSISGKDFTAKDFRTWAGSVQAIKAFRDLTDAETDRKKNIIAAINQVAAHLGNTPTVCKKYYVHPIIIDLYQADRLQLYLAKGVSNKNSDVDLAEEEALLLHILEREKLV